MAAAALFFLTLGDDFAFYVDEWNFMVERRGHDLDVFLDPQNGHLMALPVLVYKAFFEVFGVGSYMPYRVMLVALELTVAGLFFALVRRRVDDAVAVAFTVAVLFFGPGWEPLLSAVGSPQIISLAAGLGMLLALDAGTRRGDVIAAVLLAVSLASFSYGLMFAGAAAVDILLRPGGPRRLWVAVAPLALYGLWVLGWAESQARLANVAGLARSVADSASAVAVSLTGLYRPGGEGGLVNPVDTTFGPPLAFALAAVVAYRLRGRARGLPRLWTLVALTVLFWLSIGLVQNEGRPPTASRYLYEGGVFVLLIVAELLNGVRLGQRGRVVLAVWLAILLVAAVPNFRGARDVFDELAEFNRSELAALELARATAAPDYEPEASAHPLVRDHYLTGIVADPYFAAIDDYDSPAYSLSELQSAPAEPRQAADLLLAEATRLGMAPAPDMPGRTPPILEPGGSIVSRSERGCLRLAPRGGQPAQAVLTIPPGGLLLRVDQDEPVEIRLRRFADTFGVELGAIAADEPVVVSPRPDAATNVPWRAQLDRISAPLTACGA